jgi:peptidoglycan/xylan/chitin deacetylase (PgdA/CDA1 family)
MPMRGPVISFTFDDVPRSAVLVGGEILRKYGLHGTYYVCMGLANTMTETGERFRRDDLQPLAASGHEIACHTYSHLSFNSHSPIEIAADLDRNQKALEQALPGYTPRQFAFPYGDVSPDGWRMVSGRFESCRRTGGDINFEPIRLNLLSAVPLYERIPLAESLGFVDELLKQPSWLIFYTHDIGKSHSSYGCTPEYFETVVSKAAGCGAEVLKIGEAVKRFESFANAPNLVASSTPGSSPLSDSAWRLFMRRIFRARSLRKR